MVWNDFSFLFVESADDLMQRDPYKEFEVSDGKFSDLLSRIQDYSFGYQYKLNPRSGVVIEYHKENNFDGLESFNYIILISFCLKKKRNKKGKAKGERKEEERRKKDERKKEERRKKEE